MSNESLQGKIAVVTGATSGIGRATVLRLARLGASVVVHGRSPERGTSVLEEAEKSGANGKIVMADLATNEGRRQVVEESFAWKGRVDIWVNNAGADVLTGPESKNSFEDKLRTVFNVDVFATIDLTRRVGERMKRQSEEISALAPFSIVNIGWDQAAHGMSGDSGEMFAASKGAIMAFTKSAAQSLAPEVRVNCVAPGWIRTSWGKQATPEWQSRATSESLLRRWGTPEDVAEVIAFLVSPAAEFLAGQVIPVNGGFRYGPKPT